MREEFKDFVLNIKEGKLRFSERAYIFFFCLLLSTFFWFLSALSENYTTKLSIPLQYLSISEDFVLVKEPPKGLEIQVRGSGFELLGEQMSLDRNRIQVDLAEARDARNQSYFILTKSLSPQIRQELDPDLDLLTIFPDSLHLATQARVSKKVAVKFNGSITLANGFGRRQEVQLIPDSIRVSGPKSFLDTLSKVNTSNFQMDKVKDSLSKKLNLIVPKNIKGLHFDHKEVELFLAVEKFTEKSLKLVIQLDSNAKALNLRTFPDQVEAYFLVPLSEYSNLNSEQLQAKVSLGDDFNQRKKLAVSINQIPDYAKLSRVEPETVEYIIRK
ncbi:MAG: hypothetical protein RIC95_06730 [Vicingaceae bacterium]